MQKVGILNSSIAKVLADMGHTDMLCIGDCGLPVPKDTPKIDLALRLGTPSFMEVAAEVAKYMKVEKIFIAPETKMKNPKQWEALQAVFPPDEIEWVLLSGHEELKQMERSCKAVIRTGETTPFSNVILGSGVIF